MSVPDVLMTAAAFAKAYLASVDRRHVGGLATRAELMARLGGPLPEQPVDAAEVIRDLARDADPGIVASAGPRYFGFVTAVAGYA
jgi:hypothetical protein